MSNLVPRAAMRTAYSLLEVMAAVTLLGIVAMVIIPRFGDQAGKAKGHACDVHKRNIEVQCQLWFRQKAAWPAADLGNIGADIQYFPEGLPVCPVDGSAYQFDATSETVVGHVH